VVEKTFEGGRDALIKAGFDVPIHTLVSISSMDNGKIVMDDTP